MFILNNMKEKSIKNQERERERMLLCAASNYLTECHSMAKRPDWAMKSWTALNINEFILFDMFQYLKYLYNILNKNFKLG